MPSTPRPATPGFSDLAWRVAGLTNLYRLLIPPLMLVVQQWAPDLSLPAQLPRLFQLTCYGYLAAGIALILSRWLPWRGPRTLALVTIAVDTTAISLLLYAAGGVASGLGILLVLPAGALALLAGGRYAFMVPALASLGVLVQQVGVYTHERAPASDYTAAGMLGAVLFVVGLLAWLLGTRLAETEALARRQEVDLASLEELSHYIVQHLRESILVVDPEGAIRLINDSASALLGENARQGAPLAGASPRLHELLGSWFEHRRSHAAPAETFTSADGTRLVRPHFAPLGQDAAGVPAAVIVFLEDTSLIAEKAQQVKLAALGRLSASIAHEIRNPVGAMSHAGQLLAESPHLTDSDRRLTDIIGKNAVRVSGIIDNVLQLSRRDATRLEQFPLRDWVEEFRQEFCETMQFPRERLQLTCDEPDIEVSADPGQLRQVLWNLCDNAVKYGLSDPAGSVVEIRLGRLPPTGRPCLEVADRGPGVKREDAERIFEPFFTGNHSGTGLGLFLARELAQTSGATLLYEPRPDGGSLFRLVFADPRRWTAWG